MRKHVIILICFFIVAFALRFFKLCSHSYSSIEIGMITTTLESIISLLPEGLRSPFYRLLLYIWIKVFSVSELSTRTLSVLFGTFSIFPCYLLAKKICKRHGAIIVAYLSTVSPFYVIYSRITTDFTISLFFISIALLLFLLFCETKLYRDRKFLFLYVLTTIIMLYSTNLGFLTLFGTWVYFLLKWRSFSRDRVKNWLLVNGFILLFYSFWLIRFYHEFPLEWNALDKMPTFLLNKLVYIFFSFSHGETVLPWDWKIVIPSGIVIIFLFISGILHLWTQKKHFSFVVVFLTVYLFPLFTNRGAPEYCIGASIIYYIIITLGLLKLNRPLFITAIVIISFFNIYSLVNLYTGKNYHKQSITDDWRKISAGIHELSDENTKVVSFHTSFEWYYSYNNFIPLSWREPLKAIKQVNGTERVIYVETFGSGVASTDDSGIYMFKSWLDKNYTLIQNIGFYKNEDYEIKRKLISRIFPDFRVQIFIYERNNMNE